MKKKIYKFVYLVEATNEYDAEEKFAELDLETIKDGAICQGTTKIK